MKKFEITNGDIVLRFTLWTNKGNVQKIESGMARFVVMGGKEMRYRPRKELKEKWLKLLSKGWKYKKDEEGQLLLPFLSLK